LPVFSGGAVAWQLLDWLKRLEYRDTIPPMLVATSGGADIRRKTSAKPVRPNGQALGLKVKDQYTIVDFAALAVDPPKAAGRELIQS
jgi:hypothetical protein